MDEGLGGYDVEFGGTSLDDRRLERKGMDTLDNRRGLVWLADFISVGRILIMFVTLNV